MLFTTFCFLATSLMSALAADTTLSTLSKPTVTVYYENLCPDSVKFFKENFYKIYSSSKLNESINLKLNPYGNTNVTVLANGSRIYTCEHGPTECERNQFHACVIKHEGNTPAVLKFVNCSLCEGYHNTSKNSTEVCAQSAGINLPAVYECLNTSEASQYYFELGQELNRTGVDVIPSVAFNNTYNKTQSSAAVINFSDALCNFVKTNNATNEYCKARENSASILSVSFLTLMIASILLAKMY